MNAPSLKLNFSLFSDCDVSNAAYFINQFIYRKNLFATFTVNDHCLTITVKLF